MKTMERNTANYSIDESMLLDLIDCGFGSTPEEALRNAIALSKRAMQYREKKTGNIVFQDRDHQKNISIQAFRPQG